MGKWADRYPQSITAYELDEEEAYEEARIQERDMLLARSEEFETRLLDKKLSSLDRLIDSIADLGKSVVDMRPVNNFTFNIFICKEMSSEEISKHVDSISKAITG